MIKNIEAYTELQIKVHEIIEVVNGIEKKVDNLISTIQEKEKEEYQKMNEIIKTVNAIVAFGKGIEIIG